MNNISRTTRGVLLAAVTAVAITGCKVNDTLNPSIVDASTFDPTSDGATLSFSAETQFFAAYQNAVVYGGYFAEEHINGAARTQASDIGRRSITAANSDLNSEIWVPMSASIVANSNVIKALGGAPGAASDINIARAQASLGFTFAIMAETFCNGVVQGGPSLTPTQLLDSAITHFNQAVTVGTAASGAEAAQLVSASKIGIARAYLQQGNNSAASTAADAALSGLSPSFSFDVITADNGTGGDGQQAGSSQRGNALYGFTYAQRLSSVPASYRALNDPRITWIDGGKAQDNVIEAYQQTKYTAITSPVPIASYLEAQYVKAEAELKGGVTGPALALIAARRAVGGQPTYTPGTDTQILTELLDQAARDFWLEGKKMGDYRRNPAEEPLISPPGAQYKPPTLVFGSDMCMPIPQAELDANPNLH